MASRFHFLQRLALFFVLSAGILFFNYSLELSEPLKPLMSHAFYASEFALIFFLLARKKLKAFPLLKESTPPSPSGSLALALLGLLAFGARLALETGLLRPLLSGAGFLFLLASLVGWYNLGKTLQAFKKELLLSTLFLGFVAFLWQVFYTHWLYLGTFTATLVARLLDLSFGSAVLDLSNPEFPIVGRQPFIAIIYPECSGIQSLLLFSALFFLAWATDFSAIDRRKALAAYALGMLGMFLVTVARIYLIIAAGILFSVDFAVQFVHSAISLLLFILYFAFYWRLAFRRIQVRGKAP